ncbi:MAG: hypothetical protein WBZ36_08080 [Candidatus Nitrosopolaris sp.]
MFKSEKKINPSSNIVIALMSQVGIAQLAHATNETSYKFGFQQGKIQYSQCTYRGDEDEDCQDRSSSCTGTWNNATRTVTNVTACVDGFVNDWKPHMRSITS